MFNYLVEQRINKRDLPMTLGEFVQVARDLSFYTLLEDDGSVVTLSRVFSEQDTNRLRLMGREVLSFKERLDFFAECFLKHHRKATTRYLKTTEKQQQDTPKPQPTQETWIDIEEIIG
jgi:hypothetical protein